MTSVSLLASLQQVQSILTSMYPSGGASTAASDSSTVASFEQILAALSPSSGVGGIMGSGTTSQATSTASAGSSSVPSGPTGADVVSDAEKYLGIPYVLDGESSTGMDCSGLVQQTYKDLGITLPRGVSGQKTMGTAVPSLAQAQPGDLIVFKGGGHVAIYEGNDTVIHAPYPGRVVSNEKLWVGDSGIETIRRIVPSAGTTTAAPATTAAPSTQTSSAVQAAALAAVQAIIQADSGLLSSTPSAPSSLSNGGTSASSQLQSALSSLQAAEGIGSTTAASTTAATSTSAAQQALAMEQSMLAQEDL
jgi:cell wall-associated NlpC family hydrolase